MVAVGHLLRLAPEQSNATERVYSVALPARLHLNRTQRLSSRKSGLFS